MASMWGALKSVVGWLQSFWIYHLHVAVVGPSYAGKSSILRLLAGNAFNEEQQSTRGFDLIEIQRQNTTIRCWDVGGQAGYQNQWPDYIKLAKIIIFVLDSSDPDSIMESKEKLHELFGNPKSLVGKKLLILANKCDIKGEITMPSDSSSPSAEPPVTLPLPLSLAQIKSRVRLKEPSGGHLVPTIQWLQVSAKERENTAEVEGWLRQAVTELAMTS